MHVVNLARKQNPQLHLQFEQANLDFEQEMKKIYEKCLLIVGSRRMLYAFAYGFASIKLYILKLCVFSPWNSFLFTQMAYNLV